MLSCPLFHLFLEQYLEDEYRKGNQLNDPNPPSKPYHYGSHYSNSGIVLHFLVRVPPFTQMFLSFQGVCTVTIATSDTVTNVDGTVFIISHNHFSFVARQQF